MAGRFPLRDAFTLPSELYEEHEWISDALLDTEIGHIATLYYPPKDDECSNCILDPDTGRSSNIYKSGGPVPFTNFTICPYCAGRGRLTSEQTEDIILRTYWDSRSWIDVGIAFEVPQNVCMVIGYMKDLPKLENATRILLNSNIKEYDKCFCEREGKAVPHGFKQNRYFIQYLRRIT